MAGLLDEFGIDSADIPDAPDWSIPDGEYRFEVGDYYAQDGSTNHPDTSYLIIKLLLGEDGKERNEWYPLPADAANPTAKELGSLTRLKARLLSLGIAPEAVNSAGPDEVVGITGDLTLITRVSKGGSFQNATITSIDGADETPAEATPAPAAKTAAKPRATRAASAAPKVPASAPAGAAATVKANPFA